MRISVMRLSRQGGCRSHYSVRKRFYRPPHLPICYLPKLPFQSHVRYGMDNAPPYVNLTAGSRTLYEMEKFIRPTLTAAIEKQFEFHMTHIP